jgi:hypothetical protein
MTRMHEQNLDTPAIARLTRGATAEDLWAWGRQVDQYPRLIWASTAECKWAGELRGAPSGAGSWCAQWRSTACLVKGVLRQGCS